jgi:hypothetical protein
MTTAGTITLHQFDEKTEVYIKSNGNKYIFCPIPYFKKYVSTLDGKIFKIEDNPNGTYVLSPMPKGSTFTYTIDNKDITFNYDDLVRTCKVSNLMTNIKLAGL